MPVSHQRQGRAATVWLNYLTYLVGAVFIILVPGPNTFFVLKTGIAHGVKKGYLAA
ncbi:hypothetical protein PUR47_30675, partial [Klebsiella pneumoniae]|nr:hypothetical protein [Klebsiella pneumoniae]